MKVEEVREDITTRVKNLDVKPEKLYEVKDIAVFSSDGTFSIRIYKPAPCDVLPSILYIHGGGWAAGNVDTHDNICRYLAKACECLVLSVDYRQPPENKYPLPFDDCHTAFDWLLDHSEELGADPDKIALVGDSAGGNSWHPFPSSCGMNAGWMACACRSWSTQHST